MYMSQTNWTHFLTNTVLSCWLFIRVEVNETTKYLHEHAAAPPLVQIDRPTSLFKSQHRPPHCARVKVTRFQSLSTARGHIFISQDQRATAHNSREGTKGPQQSLRKTKP